MYNPRSFKVEERQRLYELIRTYNFGIMFSQSEGKALATHIPFLIEIDDKDNASLIGHLARANPQWKSWDDNSELLIVFQGPHAYISPAWYHDQKTVPTWNYAAVHVYGCPHLIHEPEELRPMVVDLVHYQEKQLGNPWDTSQMEDVIETELKAIVGFRIPIRRIEGKFKFNQNRSEEDRKSVVCHMARSEAAHEREVARVMKKQLEE